MLSDIGGVSGIVDEFVGDLSSFDRLLDGLGSPSFTYELLFRRDRHVLPPPPSVLNHLVCASIPLAGMAWGLNRCAV